jgi:FKBP-type peptidyl-prolyl cis-trans isomerase FkpA
MRKLSKNETVAVWVAVVVVFAAFLFGNNLFAFFSPSPADEHLAIPDDMSGDSMDLSTSTIPTPTSISQTNQPKPTTMNNGLVITDEKVGTGAEAVAGKTITVNYTGTFTDGTVFDSSLKPGRTPFQFVLGAGMVIPGWDQGFAGMKVGGKRKLVIPSDLAYGPNDYNGIPGGSTLIFEVELLDVK